MWDLFKSYWNSVPNTGQTILIGIVSALVTMFAVDPIRRKRDKFWAKKDAEEKQLADRSNPELNVRREYEETVGMQSWMRGTKKWWIINPFWIYQEGEIVKIKSWDDMELRDWVLRKLHEESKEAQSFFDPLAWERVERARNRKEWIIAVETSEGLDYDTVQACSAEESYLFQPIPVGKKRNRKDDTG